MGPWLLQPPRKAGKLTAQVLRHLRDPSTPDRGGVHSADAARLALAYLQTPRGAGSTVWSRLGTSPSPFQPPCVTGPTTCLSCAAHPSTFKPRASRGPLAQGQNAALRHLSTPARRGFTRDCIAASPSSAFNPCTTRGTPGIWVETSLASPSTPAQRGAHPNRKP